MTLQSPVKKIYITQVFGVNAASYAKYGLKGHNGIDFRAFLPNGERCYEGGKSEVFAPHDGKVLENVFDAAGYGWYIKIENEKEGSVLAHFSHQSPCKVGSFVKMGEFIGFQGTTGNSTGIHLHWGYYKLPRDRSNGFNGYINQEGLYTPYGTQNEAPGGSMYKGYDLTNAESMKVAVDVLVRVQNGEFVDKSVHEDMVKLKDRYRSERTKAREERDSLQKQLDVVIPKLDKVVEENTNLKDAANEDLEEINALVQRIDELEIELSKRSECKKCEQPPVSTPAPRVPKMTLIDYILKLLKGEK